VFEFLAISVLSNLAAIFLYLLVEAPVGNLDKELLGNVKILPYPRNRKPLPVKTKVEKVELGEQQN